MVTNLEHYKDLLADSHVDMCCVYKKKICGFEWCECNDCIGCHREFRERA